MTFRLKTRENQRECSVCRELSIHITRSVTEGGIRLLHGCCLSFTSSVFLRWNTATHSTLGFPQMWHFPGKEKLKIHMTWAQTRFQQFLFIYSIFWKPWSLYLKLANASVLVAKTRSPPATTTTVLMRPSTGADESRQLSSIWGIAAFFSFSHRGQHLPRHLPLPPLSSFYIHDSEQRLLGRGWILSLFSSSEGRLHESLGETFLHLWVGAEQVFIKSCSQSATHWRTHPVHLAHRHIGNTQNTQVILRMLKLRSTLSFQKSSGTFKTNQNNKFKLK